MQLFILAILAKMNMEKFSHKRYMIQVANMKLTLVMETEIPSIIRSIHGRFSS
ncbi:MAG: hypothetical protein K5930_08945 [Treponemataceae bacterium]|nr:hypothetical protein [Treponemataceae bacterium]